MRTSSLTEPIEHLRITDSRLAGRLQHCLRLVRWVGDVLVHPGRAEKPSGRYCGLRAARCNAARSLGVRTGSSACVTSLQPLEVTREICTASSREMVPPAPGEVQGLRVGLTDHRGAQAEAGRVYHPHVNGQVRSGSRTGYVRRGEGCSVVEEQASAGLQARSSAHPDCFSHGTVTDWRPRRETCRSGFADARQRHSGSDAAVRCLSCT